MDRNEQRLPKRMEKLVYQEASSRCSFCTEDGVDLLEIHHIVPRVEGGSNELSNLILVCRNCHARVGSGEISRAEVTRRKQELKIIPFPRRATNAENNLIVEGNVVSSIIGNSVTIVNRGKRLPPVAPLSGSIGADLDRKNYINHLVGRYHDFRKADKHYGRVESYNPAVLHASIKRKFKARLTDIPVSRFDELMRFLQNKIDQTIQGKRNRKNGVKSYSSFDDYLQELYGVKGS